MVLHPRQAPSENSHTATNEGPDTQMNIESLQATIAYIRARFGADERGASLVEYALLVALIAVICIVAIAFLGQSASSKFSTVGSGIAG